MTSSLKVIKFSELARDAFRKEMWPQTDTNYNKPQLVKMKRKGGYEMSSVNWYLQYNPYTYEWRE